MKVLCFIDSLGSGGAQRQIVEIAKGLKNIGHEVVVLVYHNEPFYLEDLSREQITIKLIETNNYLIRIVSICYYIHRQNFDTIISFLDTPNFIASIASILFKKWKLIVGERNANPHIQKSLKLKFYKRFHDIPDYIVSNSHENVRIIQSVNKRLANNKFRVIYNSLNANYWSPVASYEPLANSKINIVVGASHQWHKNASNLIQATNLLEKDLLSRIKIKWYGAKTEDGSYNHNLDLISKFKLTDIIEFHEPVKDMKTVIQHADAVLLCSFYEGMPNIICEGLVVGKLVLCSGVSDLPKILKNTENILLNPNDIHDIAIGLRKACDLTIDDLRRIGKNNRDTFRLLFDREKNFESLVELLNE